MSSLPVVGVDIGGTKTHIRLRRAGAERDLILPTAQWRHRHWDRDAAALLELISGFCGGEAFAALGIGAHGCDDLAECLAFESAIAARTPVPVRVVNDAELMPAALGLEGQIGLVAGTGSVAVTRTGAGEMLVAGGWGWIIGDEGGSASLVREAARAVALHLDRGGSPAEPLVVALFAALEIPSAARIGSRLGASGGASSVGAHAPIIFASADQDSKLAEQVIREAGLALADLVTRLRGRGATATTVVAGGSVIVAQDRLWRAFSDSVLRLCDGEVTPLLCTAAPVTGALTLAEALLATSAPAALAAPSS